MFKKLRLPIFAVIIASLLGQTAADAAYDRRLYRKLLRNIYANSERGDGGDIYVFIRTALAENSSQGTELVDRLISALEDNLDQLAFDVSKDDLRRIRRQLRSYLKRREAARLAAQSTVNPTESSTRNN